MARSKHVQSLLSCGYLILAAFIYVHSFSRLYAEVPDIGIEGYSFHFHPFVFFCNLIVLLLCYLGLPKKIQDPLGILLYFYYLIVLYSIAMQFSFTTNKFLVEHELYFLWFVLVFFLFRSLRASQNNFLVKTKKRLGLHQYFKLYIICTLVVILYLIYVYMQVLGFHLLKYAAIYNQREQFANALGKRYVFNILYSWVIHICLPMLLCYALWYKKKWLSIVFTCLALVLFLMTGLKSIFVIYLITAGVALSLRKRGYIELNHVIFVFFLSILLTLINCNVYNFIVLLRLFSVVGMLSSKYLIYFINHQAWLFGLSFSSDVSLSNIAYDVAASYSTQPGNAVTSYISTALVEFGFVGMCIIQMLVMIYLWLYQSLYCTLGGVFQRVLFLISFIPVIELLFNTSALTAMISGGGVLVLVLLYFMSSSVVER